MPNRYVKRVLILDLKWSYGVERMTLCIREQLGKYCDVAVLSGSESLCSETTKIAPSKSYGQMLAAFLNPLVYWRIFRNIAQFRPDVIYTNSPHMLHAAIILLCRVFTSIYLISHIHDPEYYGNKLVAGTANAVAFIQSRCSHRIYCCGKAIRDAISEKFGVPKDCIGIFRLGPQQGTFYDEHDGVELDPQFGQFSFIGSIHERKGIDVFLRAAIRFNELSGCGRVRFYLAGAGELDRYQDLIQRVPNLTIYSGFLSDREINEVLRRSYALVLPYIGGMMQTSFVAIAFGNGCPVLVSNNGSMHEEVEDGTTGFIVEKQNVEELALKMVKASANTTRVRMLRECVRSYREKFDWTVIGKAIYEDMADCCMKQRDHQS